jgi:hypothetical protein
MAAHWNCRAENSDGLHKLTEKELTQLLAILAKVGLVANVEASDDGQIPKGD